LEEARRKIEKGKIVMKEAKIGRGKMVRNEKREKNSLQSKHSANCREKK